MASGITLAIKAEGGAKARRELDKTGKSARGMGKDLKAGGTGAAALTAGINPMAIAVVAAGAALVAAAAAVLAFKKAAEGVLRETLELAENLDEIGKKARSVGASAEDMQLLIGAFELAGIESGQFLKSAQKLNQGMGEAIKGTKSYTDAFDALGLSTSDLVAVPLRERFLAIAGGMENLGTQAERAQVAALLFGRTGKDMLVAFESREGLEGAIADMERFGIASNASVRDAEALQDSILRLEKAALSLKVNVLTPLIPVLTGVADGVLAIIQNMDDKAVANFGRALADAVAEPVIQAMFALAQSVHQVLLVLRPAAKQALALALALLHPLKAWELQKDSLTDIRNLSEDLTRANEFYAESFETVAVAIRKARMEGDRLAAGGGGGLGLGGGGGAAAGGPSGKAGAEAAAAEMARIAEEGIRANREKNDTLIAEEARRADEMKRIREEEERAETARQQRLHEMQRQYVRDQVSAAQAGLNAIGEFAQIIAEATAETYGETSKQAREAAKAAFLVQQAAGLAQAIISMAVAIGQGNASAPYPYNIPAIVAAGITGGIQIATIAATTIAGVADAGLPPGALRRAGLNNHTMFAVGRDEMVLDPQGTKAISQMLQNGGTGGSQPVVVNTTLELDGQVLGQTVDNHLVRSAERGIPYTAGIRYGSR